MKLNARLIMNEVFLNAMIMITQQFVLAYFLIACGEEEKNDMDYCDKTCRYHFYRMFFFQKYSENHT
jgi:hypothetical protein